MKSNKPAIPTFNSLAKADLMKVSDRITTAVESGNMGALNAFAIAKGLKYVADKIIKIIESDAIDEGFEYNKNDRSIYGAKFAHVDGGALYDYEADQEYKELSEALKVRKALLDSAKKAGRDIIEGDEIIKPPPIKGYRKSFLRFDF